MKRAFTAKDIRDVLLISAAIIAVLFIFLWPMEVTGDSMTPGFTNGDRIVISRALAFFDRLDYRDVIVLKHPESGITIIKRVVALPGDKVLIAEGTLYVNGSPVLENGVSAIPPWESADLTLKADEYFVLGDNRTVSADSREFGPVNKKLLTGKVLFTWYRA